MKKIIEIEQQSRTTEKLKATKTNKLQQLKETKISKLKINLPLHATYTFSREEIQTLGIRTCLFLSELIHQRNHEGEIIEDFVLVSKKTIHSNIAIGYKTQNKIREKLQKKGFIEVGIIDIPNKPTQIGYKIFKNLSGERI